MIFYKRAPWVGISLLLLFSFVVLLRTSWISDDAAITLRTVLNTIHGFGPRFNVDERVQAYTHPLWFFLHVLVWPILGNIFGTSFFLSLLFSLLSILLISRAISDFRVAIFANLTLLMCRSFIDFSGSGLENPLGHALIIVWFLKNRSYAQNPTEQLAFLISFLVSLSYLTRPDLPLLFFPVLAISVVRSWKSRKHSLKPIFLGITPIIVWTLFSVFYYGSPFPNTAYAKMFTGIPVSEKLIRGYFYFFDSFERDPLTLVVIFSSGLICLLKAKNLFPYFCGILLYGLYILTIGGDFMSGRFLSAPLVLAVLILVSCNLDRKALVFFGLCFVLVGYKNINKTLLSDPNLTNQEFNRFGVADERAYYFRRFGLINVESDFFAEPSWTFDGLRGVVVMCGGLGFKSLLAGPSTHFVDNCALADPLMARLPAKPDPFWRVGHFYRTVPEGYVESIREGQNLLVDPSTKNLYEIIRRVTRAPLFASGRLQNILKLNLNWVNRTEAK